jgi:hypothetical protein
MVTRGTVHIRSNDKAERPPPETPGRLQESLTICLNRPTVKRGGGSLQHPGQASSSLPHRLLLCLEGLALESSSLVR